MAVWFGRFLRLVGLLDTCGVYGVVDFLVFWFRVGCCGTDLCGDVIMLNAPLGLYSRWGGLRICCWWFRGF